VCVCVLRFASFEGFVFFYIYFFFNEHLLFFFPGKRVKKIYSPASRKSITISPAKRRPFFVPSKTYSRARHEPSRSVYYVVAYTRPDGKDVVVSMTSFRARVIKTRQTTTTTKKRLNCYEDRFCVLLARVKHIPFQSVRAHVPPAFLSVPHNV